MILHTKQVLGDEVTPPPTAEGVRLGLAGSVALMSGTNRDENNLFMARNSRGRGSHLSTALYIPPVIV